MFLQDINKSLSLRISFTTYLSTVRGKIRSIINQKYLDAVHRPIFTKFLRLILSEK